MPAWFYVLRLRSGALYPGATKNLEERYKAHIAGKACRTTKLDPPLKLIYSESFPTFSEARKRETQIKRWTSAKKEALVAGDMVKLQNLSKSKNKKDSNLLQQRPRKVPFYKGLNLYTIEFQRISGKFFIRGFQCIFPGNDGYCLFFGAGRKVLFCRFCYLPFG